MILNMGIEEAILQEIKEQGIEKGIERNTIAVVLRMDKADFSIEQITQATGLTTQQIEDILIVNK